MTKLRNTSNAIKYMIRSDDTKAETAQEIHEHAVGFFSELLGMARGELCPELTNLLLDLSLPRCSNGHLIVLDAPVIVWKV